MLLQHYKRLSSGDGLVLKIDLVMKDKLLKVREHTNALSHATSKVSQQSQSSIHHRAPCMYAHHYEWCLLRLIWWHMYRHVYS
jgi:hypothetical protein